MKIYEYAIVYTPSTEAKKAGKMAAIIVKPTQVLAPDEKAAAMLAGRAIPEEYLAHLDCLEVAIRPF